MARRKVIWHIGPVDPGTSFLADALRERSEELNELGIATPTGAWHEVEDQIWKHKGLSLLSTPDVAGAEAGRVALQLNGLQGVEVHLVVLVRDLPTQVYAAWQDALRHGSSTTLKKFALRVMEPERSHWQAEEFWAGRDLAQVLATWTRAIPADRVHVVSAPQDPDGTWSAFLDVAGILGIERPDVFIPPALRAELDGERVLDVTTAWAKLAADRGFDVRGSLIGASTAVSDDGAGRNAQLEALGELLTETTAEIERLRAEVARLSAENDRLDSKRLKHKRRVERLRAELNTPD